MYAAECTHAVTYASECSCACADAAYVNKGSDGLNPNRQRGFAAQSRIETPTLNDMKAKQGAIVSKFMTFAKRMNTVMTEIDDKLGSQLDQTKLSLLEG